MSQLILVNESYRIQTTDATPVNVVTVSFPSDGTVMSFYWVGWSRDISGPNVHQERCRGISSRFGGSLIPTAFYAPLQIGTIVDTMNLFAPGTTLQARVTGAAGVTMEHGGSFWGIMRTP